MCDALAIAAVGQGLSLMQQQAQADQINAAADRQDRTIRETAVQNYNQLNRQVVEDAQNAATEGFRHSREVTQRVATGKAQAGATGVSGLSVDAMLLDLSGKGLEAQTTADKNYARTMAARQDQAVEIERGAAGQLSNLQRASGVTGLDVLGAGLKIGSAYVTQQAETKRAALGGYANLGDQRTTARERLGLKP